MKLWKMQSAEFDASATIGKCEIATISVEGVGENA